VWGGGGVPVHEKQRKAGATADGGPAGRRDLRVGAQRTGRRGCVLVFSKYDGPSSFLTVRTVFLMYETGFFTYHDFSTITSSSRIINRDVLV
jgi:hypothetical protein